MTRLTDQQQREQALDTSQSWIVQAPAGSGKTELLTRRYLKLLGQVSRPERILAITFTRKASQEMRERIMARLRQAADTGAGAVDQHEEIAVKLAKQVLERDREQGWNLLHNPRRLRISTIDSLCSELAARQPLLAGNAWNLPVTENARPLYEMAARQSLLDPGLGSHDPQAEQALQRVLVFLEGKADKLCGLLATMLGNRDQWLRGGALSEVQPDLLAKEIDKIHARLLDEIHAVLGPGPLQQAICWLACIGGSTAEKTSQSAAELNRLLDSDQPEHNLLLVQHACKALLTATQKTLRKPGGLTAGNGFSADNEQQKEAITGLRGLLETWSATDGAEAAMARLANNIPVLPGSEAQQLLNDLKLLLLNSLAFLQVVFEDQGRCDFLAVSEAALSALGSEEAPSDVLLAEDNRIAHILLDEFQDTNRGQFELLGKLIAGWQPGDGRSLFLVGDPMQSIYGFREAEVGLFLAIWNSGQLGPVELKPLRLENNFRSHRELLDWVNARFPDIFPATADARLGAVSYTPFTPYKGEGGGVSSHWIGPGEDAEAEAEAVAGLIQSLAASASDDTIAVLVRSKKQLTPIAHALLRRGIDFEAVEADPLATRPVVMDLLALCRALLQPLDRIAWIALLRAPWCALSVGELHALLGDDHSVPVADCLQPGRVNAVLQADSAQRVLLLAGVLRRAGTTRGVESLARRVERCWLQLAGPYAVIESAELDNARSFLRCLREVDVQQPDDPMGELEQRLASMFAPNRRHCKVQLMSIHKAKGLEFDRVILPGLERTTGGGSDPPLVRWQAYPDGRVLIAPRNARNFEGNSLYEYLRQETQLREQFETQRVLYVALTRARNHLYLFGRIRFNKNGMATPSAASFLGLLWPSLEDQVAVPEAENEIQNTVPPVLPLLQLNVLPRFLPAVQAALLDTERAPVSGHVPRPATIALGQALHACLEVAHNNPERFPAGQAAAFPEPVLSSILHNAGAQAAELTELLPQLQQAVNTALGTERGRKIVLGSGTDRSCAEYGLRIMSGQALQKRVLDRVDWTAGKAVITDYKTGAVHMEQWQVQLNEYARVFEEASGVPVGRLQIYQPETNTIHPIRQD